MVRKTIVGLSAALLLASAGAASAQMRITEYSASPAPEFVEFTNMGNAAIDLTGWSWSDSDEQPGDQPLLGTFGLVQSHESVIFTEGDPTDFRTRWGLPGSVNVVGGNTNSNLSSGGDEINIYDAVGNLVDRLTYTSAFNGVPNSRNILSTQLGLNHAPLSVLSSVGDAFSSHVATDGRVGNPGFYPFASVPEPASIVLMVLGGIGLALIRRRH